MGNPEAVGLLNLLFGLDGVQLLAVAALPILFAITLHEVAHGWAARLRGDRTAEMLGRLTLNPIKHIDPVGTLLVPAAAMVMFGFFFGWAKPVPVTVQNLKRRNKDMAFVAAAGPASNLLQAFFWLAMFALGRVVATQLSAEAGYFLIYAGIAGVLVNVVLAVLNMLPIPPLDGGRVVSALLPGPLSYKYDRIEPFGIWIVLGLLLLGVLGKVLLPVVIGIVGLYFQLVL